MNVGYSNTPLIQKLGIHKVHTAIILHAPDNYSQLLVGLPEDLQLKHTLHPNSEFIHYFANNKYELETMFPQLSQSLAKNGTLWISWQKQSAKQNTDLNENIVREIGLNNGVVDVKVAAIDEGWSGLKFVYRLKDRKR